MSRQVFVIDRGGERVYIPGPNSGYNIESIAHSLAGQFRFNNHTRAPYSVAQHCCLAAQYVKHKGFGPRSVLKALLHDAAEAYMGDIVSPVKSMMPPALREAERQLNMDIFLWAVMDVPPDEHMLTDDMLDTIDHALYICERRALFPRGADWGDDDAPLPFHFEIKPWLPETAEAEFLKLFYTFSKQEKHDG